MAERQPARPRLRFLDTEGPGPYRLNWLGHVRKASNHSASGYEIIAQFVHAAQPDLVREIPVPLGSMHLLALGTVWRQSFYTGAIPAKEAIVRLDLAHLDLEGANKAVDPIDVIPPFKYPLHRMERRGWCRVLPTTDGEEFVFPNAEIIRTWLLYEPGIVPVILADGIAHPGAVSRKLLPWDPERTYRVDDEVVHMTYRPGVTDHRRKRLARLLFDPRAVRWAHAFAGRFRVFAENDCFSLPWALPPFDGQLELRVRYTDIPGWRASGRPSRKLVLSILGVMHPPPFRLLTTEPWSDTRQDPNASRASLPVVPRRTSEIILPSDGGLELYGNAGDHALETASLEALPFFDSVYDVPSTTLPRRHPQTHRSGVGTPPPVVVEAAGVDPAGLPCPGVAPAAGSDSMPRGLWSGPPDADPTLPAATLLEIRPVFDGVISSLQLLLPDWSVHYLATNSSTEGVLNIQHTESEYFRPFLILHLKRPGRNVYVVRAGCWRDYESFRILICERVVGAAITLSEFADWLGGFPYPYGSKWLDREEGALELRCRTVVHQPRRKNSTTETWYRRFVERITDEVVLAVG